MVVLYASLSKDVDKRIEKEYTLIDKVFFDSENLYRIKDKKRSD